MMFTKFFKREKKNAYSKHVENMQKQYTQKTKHKSLVFMGTKGGCGNTFISQNIAQALCLATNESTLYIQFSDFCDGLYFIQKNIQKTHTEAIERYRDLKNFSDEEFMSIPIKNENFSLLFYEVSTTKNDFEKTNEMFQKILQAARNCYKVIVIDIPPTFRHFSAITEYSDAIILTTFYDPQSLGRNFELKNFYKDSPHKIKIYTLFNQCLKPPRNFPGNILGTLPFDEDAARHVQTNKAPFIHNSKYSLSKSIVKLLYAIDSLGK